MTWTGNFDKLFIGGEWVDPASDRCIEVMSPATEEEVARVPAGSEQDIDRAVAAARDAFDHGEWPHLSLTERMAVLRRISAALAEREETIAQLVTTEMGCPISLSRVMQARNPRLYLDSFLDVAADYEWSSVRRSATGNALVTREPVGVVAAIAPWNGPLLVAILKLAPALLAGCTVVLKPSPETPLDAYLLAEILIEAGLPNGVVNIVAAGREVSEYLVKHPGVDKVSFTGSTAAGRRIAALCGQDLRRVTLELGGKSAAILLDDADLDVVAASIRGGSLLNSGQTCANKTRIVAPRSRRDELLDRLATRVGSMTVGDPFDPATQIGPLVSATQRDRVENYIESARGEGALVLVGGGRPEGLDTGWYVEPTVFADVDPAAKIAQEEVFGPVLTVHFFDTEEQAVAIANGTRYGLSGSVFSVDPTRALRLARRIRSGTVEVNGAYAGFHAPFGGFEDSGIGREGGPEGFEGYVEVKTYGLPGGLTA